jgi:hypothetical protein
MFSEFKREGGLAGLILRSVLRFFQFVLAITVAGLYGTDLHAANKAHYHVDGPLRKWVSDEQGQT